MMNILHIFNFFLVNDKIIKMKYFILFFILFFSFHQNTWSKNVSTEFLIAKPHMQDSRFQETVIIMLYHNQKKGAAGLVINKPFKTISLNQLFINNNLNFPKNMGKKEVTLYWGGPVNPKQIFFIHSSDYKSKKFISSNKDFTVTQSSEILFDIAKNKGPKKYVILLGIAVWESGQLDFEIKQGSWRKIKSSYSMLFNKDSEIWKQFLHSQDI